MRNLKLLAKRRERARVFRAGHRLRRIAEDEKMLRKKIENFGTVFEPAAIDETRRHLTRREFAQM